MRMQQARTTNEANPQRCEHRKDISRRSVVAACQGEAAWHVNYGPVINPTSAKSGQKWGTQSAL
jgi:hypothetical protein